MKQPVIIAILLLIALGAFNGVAIFPAAADAVIIIKEFPNTNDSNDKYLPDIDGYHIGYQDNRNGNWDISMADLSHSANPMPVSASPATPDGPIGDSEQGRGALSVASIPFGATILIDGTDYGTTNKLVKDVPAGTRNLTLIKAGYQPTSMLVNVPEGGLKALPSVILVPAEGAGTPGGTGSLSIASIPFGATILIDGTDYGTTNKLVRDVPAGTRNLTLIKAGYQPSSMLVNVPEGGLKALPSVILVKAPQLPGDVETLQAAVDAASDGDTILLKKGTYHENIVINKSVTLIGFGPGNTIISGDTGTEIIKGGVINITKPFLQSSGPNVTLVGMTIMQGTAQYGGGIFNSEGTLTLSGVSITISTASFSGGGIYNQMGIVVMNGSMVAENTAKVGAGVMNDGGTFVLNEGSSISGNSAQIAGGLDNLAGTVIMNDGSSLTNNSATYDGGGMYSYFYSTITLNGGTITGNTAETGTGGGIYSDSDSIVNLFGGDVSGNIPNDIYYFT